MHGSTDPASTFQRQMEAHGFQVVSCEASHGEYDFGHDANSLVAELRAMGGPFSGSFIRYRVRERRLMQLNRNQYSRRQASTYLPRKLLYLLRDEERRGEYLLDFAAEYAAGQWSSVGGTKYTLVVALAKKPIAAVSFPIPTQEEKK